jgi:hypothetical protein
MSEKHNEYKETLEQYAESRISNAFLDIDEELDHIESLVDTDPSQKILLIWIRDAIERIADNYRK